MRERIGLRDGFHAALLRRAACGELLPLHGRYTFTLRRAGRVLWQESADNLITDAGVHLLLDTLLATSTTYTTTGPFLGLISSASYTAPPAASDTMASHAGWYEAGSTYAPQWDTPAGTRINCSAAFTPAAGRAKVLAPQTFVFSTTGTVKGAFLVLGTGAVSTILNASGTLLSVGLFPTGDKGPVQDNDQLDVGWSLGAA